MGTQDTWPRFSTFCYSNQLHQGLSRQQRAAPFWITPLSGKLGSALVIKGSRDEIWSCLPHVRHSDEHCCQIGHGFACPASQLNFSLCLSLLPPPSFHRCFILRNIYSEKYRLGDGGGGEVTETVPSGEMSVSMFLQGTVLGFSFFPLPRFLSASATPPTPPQSCGSGC